MVAARNFRLLAELEDAEKDQGRSRASYGACQAARLPHTPPPLERTPPLRLATVIYDPRLYIGRLLWCAAQV